MSWTVLVVLVLVGRAAAGPPREVRIALRGEQSGTARHSMLYDQTTRYAVPFPPGSRAGRAALTFREDSGVTATDEITLKRA